jgi:hypothetical protein
MEPIGTIRQLARYPVKSMRGEALPSAALTAKGVPEDRRYAFVQTASRSAFPWLTARELPEMLCYRPILEASDSEKPKVTVITPDGRKLPVESEKLRQELEARSGRAIFLVNHHRGRYDAAVMSVISRQTIAQIAEESGTEENAWRFRPNLLVDLRSGAGYEEQNWIGHVLRVGSTARIAINEPDNRCVIITLDPETAASSPAILRYVAQHHDRRAGVYGTVLAPGETRVGDPVWLEP